MDKGKVNNGKHFDDTFIHDDNPTSIDTQAPLDSQAQAPWSVRSSRFNKL